MGVPLFADTAFDSAWNDRVWLNKWILNGTCTVAKISGEFVTN